MRKKGERKNRGSQRRGKEGDNSKRQLINVMITEGVLEDYGSGKKKRKADSGGRLCQNLLLEVVLET